MASPSFSTLAIVLFFTVITFSAPVTAFGAGNIASIAKIEGHNWRHGDIEDVLKTVAFLRGHKWTSMMIRRVYFGNWLRDYSQAVDVGTLKGVQSGTIRILVWVLSFLSFGYATAEFEVTEERLGVYRPEEHIDNPRGYADDLDARQYDPRLRGPVQPEEIAIDPRSGMKNYIANEWGGWATSSGYIKHSFSRSIHFGRVYTSAPHGVRGNESDLCEALRCMGQALHCLEDFGAHSNYTELALRELGYLNVFPHVGTATELNLNGRRVFPLVTGTFGAVDFLHSVLGEATDHFTQTEVEEMDMALGNAQSQSKRSSAGSGPAQGPLTGLTSVLSQLPVVGSGLCQQAQRLQAAADAQAHRNRGMEDGGHRGIEDNESNRAAAPTAFAAPPGTVGGPPGPGIPGMDPNFDPLKTIAQIYPILEFRDKVVRAISSTIEKIPGLQTLCEKISERVTLFVLSLLAPFIRPIINAVSAQLKQGSSAVVDSSGRHQYEPWTDPNCTDPTHSLLSKDHFSNVLNEPAGQVAAATLQYVAPRIIYAWSNPDVPLDQVLNDVNRVFHHPAMRESHCEIHNVMFDTVARWARSRPDGGSSLNEILGSESVRAGRNHIGGHDAGHSHGGGGYTGAIFGQGSHSKVAGSEWRSALGRRDPGASREFEGIANPELHYDAPAPSQPVYSDAYQQPAPPADYAYQSYNSNPEAAGNSGPPYQPGSNVPSAYGFGPPSGPYGGNQY
ncbi:MAG: hypothetical protein M1817_001717 [Caeruleum heppii]|nr:MAG: hypothetical protein M1817_001717 [Caeruleum heppii]